MTGQGQRQGWMRSQSAEVALAGTGRFGDARRVSQCRVRYVAVQTRLLYTSHQRDSLKPTTASRDDPIPAGS